MQVRPCSHCCRDSRGIGERRVSGPILAPPHRKRGASLDQDPHIRVQVTRRHRWVGVARHTLHHVQGDAAVRHPRQGCVPQPVTHGNGASGSSATSLCAFSIGSLTTVQPLGTHRAIMRPTARYAGPRGSQIPKSVGTHRHLGRSSAEPQETSIAESLRLFAAALLVLASGQSGADPGIQVCEFG